MLELKLGTTKFYLRSDLLTVFTAASNEGGCINVADARKLRDWLVANIQEPVCDICNFPLTPEGNCLRCLNLVR